MVAQNVIAFSVHTFDQPLENNPRPNRVWGDLHLSFDTTQSSSAENLPEVIEFLVANDVPGPSVKAYYVDNDVEIIIAEHAFRGEIGSPCRLDFDRAIRLSLEMDSIRQVEINSVPIPMSQVLVWELKAPKELEGVAHPLCINNDYFKGSHITPLTRRYFIHHAAFKGQKDYLPAQLAFMTKCNIFNTLLTQGGTAHETVIVCDLFGGHIPFFEHLLHLHGRIDLIFKSLPQELIKYRAHKKHRIGCTNIESALSQFPGKYKCNRGCGVSSPIALAYLPTPPGPKTISFEDEHFSLNATGLYSVEPERNRKTRVMNPIWVKNTLQANEDDLGAREVIYYDVNGFRDKLVIKEELIDSSKLFPLLRSKGIHVPKDTVLRGKFRQYLASQFPPKRPKTPAVYVSGYGGWQKDNSFIFPGSTISTSSTYALQSHQLPEGVESKNLLPNTSINKTTSDPDILLATLASLSAPFLKLLKFPGICLHFHGGTKPGRAAIVHAASSVWNQSPFKFADVKRHIVALKMQHKDTTLGIFEVPPGETKSMGSILRRYFKGRKGAERGVTGVIVSCGEEPIGQAENRQKGLNAYTYQHSLMAIDISLENMDIQGFRFDHNATRALVEDLTTRKDDLLKQMNSDENRFKEQLRWAKSPRPNKQASDYLRLLMAVGYAESNQHCWWGGGPFQPIFHQIMSTIDCQESCFVSFLKAMNVYMPIPDMVFGFEVSSSKSFIEIDPKRVLAPSSKMAEITKDRQTLLQFIQWLKAQKIVIPKRPGILCGEYYSPQHKNTIRGYMINRYYFNKVLLEHTS